MPLIADDEVHVGLWFPGSFSHFLIGIKRVGCLDVSLFSPFPFRLDDFMTIIPFPALRVRQLCLALGGCMVGLMLRLASTAYCVVEEVFEGMCLTACLCIYSGAQPSTKTITRQVWIAISGRLHITSSRPPPVILI